MLLKLKPEKGTVSCPLHEITAGESRGLDIRRVAETKLQVYADQEYGSFNIIFDEGVPTWLNVYLNNESLQFVRQDLADNVIKCILPQDSRMLFADCYGYVCFEVECSWEGNTTYYSSDYLEVLVRSTEVTDALGAMVKYIGRYYDKYLRADYSAKGSYGFTGREGTISRLLDMCRQVRDVYEQMLPVFKANPYRVIGSAYKVDGIEKLRQATPETLYYVTQHPELLVSTPAETAIQYDGTYFIPRKALILNTIQNTDNYENRVVIGFLLTVLDSMNRLLADIKRYTNYCRARHWTGSGYRSSVDAVVHIMGRALISQREEGLEIYAAIKDLYRVYSAYFPVKEMPVQGLPEPTQVFLEEIHYRGIYEVIQNWFNFGSYDIEQEEYLLPFAGNSSLYEYYSLFKIAESLERNGFHFESKRSVRFDYPSVPWYVPGGKAEHTNTFIFRKNGDEWMTLYFQPVIYGGAYSEASANGIGLRRATSLKLEGMVFPDKQDSFYTPDFILKYHGSEKDRYLIIDAKLSRIWTKLLTDLAFKYSFSIRPTDTHSELCGVLILFGKEFDKPAELTDVYDICGGGGGPSFSFVSMTESEGCPTESHDATLDEIIRELISCCPPDDDPEL